MIIKVDMLHVQQKNPESDKGMFNTVSTLIKGTVISDVRTPSSITHPTLVYPLMPNRQVYGIHSGSSTGHMETDT